MKSDDKIVKKYLAIQQRARNKNLNFNLTLTSIRNLLSAKYCYYSGEVLTDATRSIDRINNSKGYEIGNVCACDIRINMLKTNLDYAKIIKLANKLKKLRGIK